MGGSVGRSEAPMCWLSVGQHSARTKGQQLNKHNASTNARGNTHLLRWLCSVVLPRGLELLRLELLRLWWGTTHDQHHAITRYSRTSHWSHNEQVANEHNSG